MYHFQPIVPTSIRTTNHTNGLGERTCHIDPNRIHELTKECRTAGPPLVDGDTPGSDIEGEKFDQVSCLHPSPLRQRMAQGSSGRLTVNQGGEC